MKRLAHPQSLVVIGLVAIALYSVRHTFSSTTIIVFAVAVPSIILHELAHGVTALAFGDDTAKRAGRLTLNPVRHVDPIGTLVLPGVLALAGLGAFGYAKPVPINPSRMRSPRNSALIVSLAGPATNLALAGVSILLLRLARPAGTAQAVNFLVSNFGVTSLNLTDRVLYLFGFVNVTLAVFNALPDTPPRRFRGGGPVAPAFGYAGLVQLPALLDGDPAGGGPPRSRQLLGSHFRTGRAGVGPSAVGMRGWARPGYGSAAGVAGPPGTTRRPGYGSAAGVAGPAGTGWRPGSIPSN